MLMTRVTARAFSSYITNSPKCLYLCINKHFIKRMKLRNTTSTLCKGHNKAMEGTIFGILVIISISHFLNDMIQSIVPAIYPIIKDKFGFTFAQIGLITFVFQMASSILQPFTGLYADKHPRPYALSLGFCLTLIGLLSLAFANSFGYIMLSVSLIGFGSAVFHPEASRVAQLASGGKRV